MKRVSLPTSVNPLRGVPYPSSPEVVAPLPSALDDQPGAKSVLERYGREQWNKEKLAGRFQQGIEWGAQHRVLLYCSEFGVYPRYDLSETRWFFVSTGMEERARYAGWCGSRERITPDDPISNIVHIGCLEKPNYA